MRMLLSLFNFIRGKEGVKLLRNFHLTKVKQIFSCFYGRGAFYGLKNKKIYNEINTEVII